jgi:hypothetical protein
MARPNYYLRTLTALTLTAAAAVLAALLIASAPASAQEASPSVWWIDPQDQQTGVPRDTNVTAVFSWNLDPSTINPDTFTLVNQSTSAPVEASVIYYDNPGRPTVGYIYCYAILDPQQDLEANTTYTATLKVGENGVKDASGAPMAADYSWSFTTGDSAAPPETTITSGACLKQVVMTSIGGVHAS